MEVTRGSRDLTLNCDIAFTRVSCRFVSHDFHCFVKNQIPVMNTRATSFPVAALAAAFKSVSENDVEMAVLSVAARLVIASAG